MSLLICEVEGKGNLLSLSVKEAITHLREMHRNTAFELRCGNCSRLFSKLRAVSVHFAKCKGGTQLQAVEAIIQCPECPRSFSTQIGLGQHIRHVHKTLCNNKRSIGTEQGPRVLRKGPAFEPEEVLLMVEVERRFYGQKRMAVKLHEYLPHKSIKQLREKRREVVYKRLLRESMLNADVPEESYDTSILNTAFPLKTGDQQRQS